MRPKIETQLNPPKIGVSVVSLPLFCTSSKRSKGFLFTHTDNPVVTGAFYCFIVLGVTTTIYQWNRIRKLTAEISTLKRIGYDDKKCSKGARHRGAGQTNNVEEELRLQNENNKDNVGSNENSSKGIDNTDDFVIKDMHPIGKVASVYRLCVGTPRQGLLAPNSRGRLDLNLLVISPDSLDQLELYSHVWVVFIFHLNTRKLSKNKTLNSLSSKKKRNHRFTSKISPPALGGKKVGIFATRTPHRPNAIGFSLCKLDSVDLKKGRVYISGLDLVDGTPILDIKPYVPHYDSVGYDLNIRKELGVSLPPWVSTGLTKRRPVIFSKEAEIQLKHFCCEQQSLKKNKNSLEFYGENELLSIRACIEEVLAVDVRSSWQTGKARKGASQADKALKVYATNSGAQLIKDVESKMDSSILCTQQIDNLLIYFNVIPESSDGNDAISRGSGCNDTVEVHHIEQILRMKKDGKSVTVSYKVSETDAQAERLNAVQQNDGQNARPEDGGKEEEKATYSDVLETLSISVGQLDVQDNNNEAVYKEVGEKMKLAFNPEEKKKAPSKLDVDIPTYEQEEDNNSSNNLTPCKRPLSNNSTPVSSPSRFKNNTAALSTVVEQRLNDTSLRFESGIPTATNKHKSKLPQVQDHNNSINLKKELKRMRKIGSDEAFAVEGSKRKEYSKKQSFEFDHTRIEKSSEIKEYYHDLKKYWNKASQKNTPSGLLPETFKSNTREGSGDKVLE